MGWVVLSYKCVFVVYLDVFFEWWVKDNLDWMVEVFIDCYCWDVNCFVMVLDEIYGVVYSIFYLFGVDFIVLMFGVVWVGFFVFFIFCCKLLVIIFGVFFFIVVVLFVGNMVMMFFC